MCVCVQGYALIEYPTLAEARAAIDGANQTKLLDQTINVDFAFVRPPPGAAGNKGGPIGGGRGARGGGGRRANRSRSRSPGAGRDREADREADRDGSRDGEADAKDDDDI